MKVVILSDAKPGHYHQSLGIVERIPDCCTSLVTVRFQQKWRDNVLRLLLSVFGARVFPVRCIHRLLRWCLTAESYDALAPLRTADVVLSTGSSVAAVTLLLGRLLDAKTVTCRRPSPVGTRHFDLAILPMFSWRGARRKTNICRTLGVPSRISPAALDALRGLLTERLNLPERPRIGVLLGGADRYETITRADAVRLSEICTATAAALNVQILLTTSRRTPPDVTALLTETLSGTDVCPLFITPDFIKPEWATELETPYQALLALSDLIIVTADSFTMVCEAASSGRNVIVLTLSQRRARRPKRQQVYEQMAAQRIISRCGLDGLEQRIGEKITAPRPAEPLRDTDAAAEAIRQLW